LVGHLFLMNFSIVGWMIDFLHMFSLLVLGERSKLDMRS
jgi:hypothetical protein